MLVDFFAQWCGPCQMLKPIIEKLAQEYDFVLAKVDIDQSPELAHTYGVEGVPDVKVVVDGTVNEWLCRHVAGAKAARVFGTATDHIRFG